RIGLRRGLDCHAVTEFKCRRPGAGHTRPAEALLMLRTVSVALILAVGVGVAHADADIYRWKDAQGIYHYSDQWVPGSELIKSAGKPRPDAPRPASSSSASSSASDSPPPEGVSAEQVQSVKDDVAKAREQQCKQAKDAYDKAIHARHIFKSAKDG